MKASAAPLPFLPPLIAPMLALAACGQSVPAGNAGGGSTTPPYVREQGEPSRLGEAVVPVRVGELGPSFAACAGRGAIGDSAGAEPAPVRAAPFDEAEAIDRLPPGASFFICARTLDQRWSGIVYDEGGTASARCGVSAPVPQRRNYGGPCAAGWVATAQVRLVSGVPHQPPAAAAAEGNASR